VKPRYKQAISKSPLFAYPLGREHPVRLTLDSAEVVVGINVWILSIELDPENFIYQGPFPDNSKIGEPCGFVSRCVLINFMEF
jgi:hypothetical protein